MKLANEKQVFNNGLVRICSVENVAEEGKKPKLELKLKNTLRFRERTIGINRYYQALQANAKITKLIRCLRLETISTQDMAIIEGLQYGIRLIQYPDNIIPKVMDLTLERIESDYDLARDNN